MVELEKALRRNTGTARLHFPKGGVPDYDDRKLAYAVWLVLPKGIRAAFRDANDSRLVYPWDYIDEL